MKRKGYLYLMQGFDIGDGLFKIGLSENVATRLQQMAILPFKVSLLHTVLCDDVTFAEQEIHWRLKKYCVRNEWFRLPVEVVAKFTSCSNQQELYLAFDIDPECKTRKVVPLLLRLPKHLYEKIKQDAERKGVSINTEIVTTLQKIHDAEVLAPLRSRTFSVSQKNKS